MTPKRVRPLLDELRAKALEHSGRRMGIRPRPWAVQIAVRLRAARVDRAGNARVCWRKHPRLEAEERLKVSRSTVRNLMASAAVGTAFSPWLKAGCTGGCANWPGDVEDHGVESGRVFFLRGLTDTRCAPPR